MNHIPSVDPVASDWQCFAGKEQCTCQQAVLFLDQYSSIGCNLLHLLRRPQQPCQVILLQISSPQRPTSLLFENIPIHCERKSKYEVYQVIVSEFRLKSEFKSNHSRVSTCRWIQRLGMLLKDSLVSLGRLALGFRPTPLDSSQTV